MEVTLAAGNLPEWVPIRFYLDNDGYFVDWCRIGPERFTQPFFEATIDARLRHPFNLLFRHQTPIDYVGEFFDQSPGLKPTGFIFHTSRCGSTLLSQMLASVERNVVISEPPPIDSVLRAKDAQRRDGLDQRVLWLKWMVSAIGQKRNASEENLFIKFDSWSTLSLDIVRRAFPDVPWVFLYRDPVEVIVSQMSQRGAHMVPGLIPEVLPNIDPDELHSMQHEEFCARVLGRICRAALQNAGDRKGLFVNYSQLPDAVAGAISEHFGVKFLPSELEQIGLKARYNAKSPQLDFETDSVKKKYAASWEVRNAASRWVEQAYNE
ncbi:MAG: sulfotransferase, partial [Acidobacteriota bacterium]